MLTLLACKIRCNGAIAIKKYTGNVVECCVHCVNWLALMK